MFYVIDLVKGFIFKLNYQYEFLCVLLSVERDGIFCGSSDIRMASHRCESFDVGEDFRGE